MAEHELKHPLLASDADDDREETVVHEPVFVANRRARRSLLVWAVLVTSIGLNVVLGGLVWRGKQEYTTNSPYSGLPRDVPTVYEFHNEWWGENRSRADELWESMRTDLIVIAPTEEWIDEKGLQRSADFRSTRFPWDPRRGLHFLKVFHQIHCLKNMRRMFIDLMEGRPLHQPESHFLHCLDSLRQDVLCYADDTPMPILNDVSDLGDGEIRQCRSLDKVMKWASEPERNACHRTLDEYRKPTHQIERWQYCPEGSPFTEAKDRYFRKFGHHDPYEPL